MSCPNIKIAIWLVHFFSVPIEAPKGCEDNVCMYVSNNIIHFPYLMKIRVVCSASSRYILEVVHSRIFDEALLATTIATVAQAFEDALEAIKQVCVCVCGMWSFSTFSSIHHTNCIIMCSKLMEKQKFPAKEGSCIGSTHVVFS